MVQNKADVNISFIFCYAIQKSILLQTLNMALYARSKTC